MCIGVRRRYFLVSVALTSLKHSLKPFFFNPTYWNSCRHLIGLILFFCWWNDSSYDWTAVCFPECRILVIRNRVIFLRFLYINSDHNLIRLQGRLHISALSKFALTYGCFRIPHTPWALQGFSHQAGHIYWRLGEAQHVDYHPLFFANNVTVLERPTPLPSIVRRSLQLKVLIWRFRKHLTKAAHFQK